FFGSDAKPEDSNTEVATDATGTFVFHDVHQANGFYPGTPTLAAKGRGLRMIPCGSPSFLPNGGWSDARLRMIATGGRVTVRVLNASGRPEAGVFVGVGISRAEPNARWEPWGSGPKSGIEQRSDAEGRVVLDDVWIQKRLEL